jgi:hypothetical protein
MFVPPAAERRAGDIDGAAGQGFANVADPAFGAVGDGKMDDTNAIQRAVDLTARQGGGNVNFPPGRVFLVSGLKPRTNVTLALFGSTLKLKDQSERPLIFDDGGSRTQRTNFAVKDGTCDGNGENNRASNISSGILWLSNWRGVTVENIHITGAARNAINLRGCEDIHISRVQCVKNGYDTTSGPAPYGYGMTLEPGTSPCRNVRIANFHVADMYGFGLHLNECEDFVAENLSFERLTFATGIAITLTRAKRGAISNVRIRNVGGDAIEINESQDVVLRRIEIRRAGRRALLIGSNRSGNYNRRIQIGNLVAQGTEAAQSVAATYIKNSEFTAIETDKSWGINQSATDDCENLIANTKIPGNADPGLFYYNKFRLKNVEFDDWYFDWYQAPTGIARPAIQKGGRGQLIDPHATLTIPLKNLLALSRRKLVVGAVDISASGSAHPAEFYRVPFVCAPNRLEISANSVHQALLSVTATPVTAALSVENLTNSVLDVVVLLHLDSV